MGHNSPGVRVDGGAIQFASGSTTVLSDFQILALPMQIIWRFHMQKKGILGFIAMFRVGLFACIASVACLAYGILLPVPIKSGEYLVNILKSGLRRYL